MLSFGNLAIDKRNRINLTKNLLNATNNQLKNKQQKEMVKPKVVVVVAWVIRRLN